MGSADGGMVIVGKLAPPFPGQIDVDVVPNNPNFVFFSILEEKNELASSCCSRC